MLLSAVRLHTDQFRQSVCLSVSLSISVNVCLLVCVRLSAQSLAHYSNSQQCSSYDVIVVTGTCDVMPRHT